VTVVSRPTPLHPPVDNFTDLQAWIDRRLSGIERDLDDEETAKAYGMRLKVTRAVLLDLAFAIRDAVQREENELTRCAHDNLVEEYLKAYGDEPLNQRRMDGDR